MANHYLDNEAFTAAVIEYALSARRAKEHGESAPKISDYLGRSIMLIAEGVVKHKKFRSRSYREDLVNSAILDCLKALQNYNPEAATRSGKPNAFGYFTRISYTTMLRKVMDETEEYTNKLSMAYQAAMDVGLEEEDRKIPEVLEYLDGLQSQYFKANLASKEKEAKKPRKPPKAKGLSEFLEE